MTGKVRTALLAYWGAAQTSGQLMGVGKCSMTVAASAVAGVFNDMKNAANVLFGSN